MKYPAIYKEYPYFSEDDTSLGLDSIRDHFCKEKYPFQDEIYEYVFNCPDANKRGARPSIERDCLTHEFIGSDIYNRFFEVEDYYWNNNLAYYIKQYNLRLPKDFEDWILERLGLKQKETK